ncbi:MAG: efflux RND transporter periplasmic adaptor subunit [Sphingobacteriales bacterium]|nr:MAG: efflux RND transporter periplasmic adaptor subunit [Sphingobacteriales bacterium]
MKQSILISTISFILLLFGACQATTGDKATELKTLKEQQNKLNEQIAALEKEVGNPSTSTTQPSKETAVEVMELRPRPFSHFLEVQGKVECNDNIAVSPKQPGIVTQVFVVRGQSVAKGDILATLDDAVFQQSLQELQTNISFAKTIFEKQKALWDQKIGTEVQYLTAKNNVETLEYKMATLQKQADLYNVRAPISGTVEEVNIKVGEGAMVGSPVPPFRIVNLSSMKVLADLAETYVSKVKVGDNAEVLLPDLGKTVNCKIKTVGNIINNAGRTFQVELKLPNIPGIRTNMVALVKIQDYSTGSTIVAPINAIQNSDEGNYVFIAEKAEDKFVAKKQIVTMGVSGGNEVEIKNGLKPGDMLIITGFQNLNTGQLVKF